MQIYPGQFLANFSQQALQQCYLVFGDEPQQKHEVLEVVRVRARQEGFDERIVLVADTGFDWQLLLEATQSMSLFSTRQLIELELPTGKPGADGSKILQTCAQSLDDNTLFIIHGPKIGKDIQKGKWFQVLDKCGVFVPCYPLEGNHLYRWLEQTLHSNQLSLSPRGIRLIADYCEGNLLAARQEIEKLALAFPNQHISDEALEKAITDQSRFNVFQLVDVMLSGDAKRCVKMLYRLESEGLEPTIVIWALTREWQTLSQLVAFQQSNQPIPWQRLGIWKNRQGHYQQAIARLSAVQLRAIADALRQADTCFKQQVIARPYVKLCHLCMLFLGLPISSMPLMD